MVAAHKAVHRAVKVDSIMLLEGNDYIFEAPAQVRRIILSERIGDQRQTYWLTSDVFQIIGKLAPMSTPKQRVTPHPVIVREAWYLSLQDPSFASGQLIWYIEFC
jgi:hypothetical protein